MASEEANMSVNCEVSHCKFATPEMSRAAYPAMVAHLQVGYQFQSWSKNPEFVYNSDQIWKAQWDFSVFIVGSFCGQAWAPNWRGYEPTGVLLWGKPPGPG